MDINKITAYGANSYDSFATASKQPAPEKTVALQQGAPVKKVASHKTTPERSPVSQEQLELSAISQSLSKVKEAITKLPDVRLPIVDEIKTKIKYNGYPMESNIYKWMEKLVDIKIKNQS